MKNSLILVRHCQNSTDRLTEHGQEQACRLADSLIHFRESAQIAIFSSDMTKALETSAIIAERLRLPIYIDNCLREANIKDLDLKTRKGIQELPETKKQLLSLRKYNCTFTTDRYEKNKQVLLRHKMVVSNALRLLTQKNTDPESTTTAILIGHGSALQILINHYNPGATLHKQGDYDLIKIPS